MRQCYTSGSQSSWISNVDFHLQLLLCSNFDLSSANIRIPNIQLPSKILPFSNMILIIRLNLLMFHKWNLTGNGIQGTMHKRCTQIWSETGFKKNLNQAVLSDCTLGRLNSFAEKSLAWDWFYKEQDLARKSSNQTAPLQCIGLHAWERWLLRFPGVKEYTTSGSQINTLSNSRLTIEVCHRYIILALTKMVGGSNHRSKHCLCYISGPQFSVLPVKQRGVVVPSQ